jgi:CO/xanthine dehydrogenase Mo-binding subunit
MPSSVGQSVTRVDALAKVKGEALYPGDFNRPGQLIMKVLFSEKVHAIVKSIDYSAAQQIPGIVAILTARDVPVNEYGLGVFDQAVLCGPRSSKPYADRVRCLADQIALIIGETDEAVEKARKLIKVEYEELPVQVDMLAAMHDSTNLIHPELDSNIFTHFRIRKGDVQDGFAQADVIVEGVYETPAQEHAYLQPEAGIAYTDEEGRITVVVAGQWTHEDREQIAHALAMPEEEIRVIYPAIGGAFGGREDMSVQIVLALAVKYLRERGIDRAVKIVWTREESIVGHHKRHPYHIKAKWGAKNDGTLVAAEVELVEDGGAYVYTSPKVLGNAILLSTGPYKISNVKVDAYAVYTNNLPNGAFRGFGGPQATFEAEGQINKLAEKLGMDPVEIRMKNLLDEGDAFSVGTPLPKGVSIKKVMEKCALQAGWTQTEAGWRAPLIDHGDEKIKKGVGVACSFKNVGFSFGAPENCWAIIELDGGETIEKAVLYHAGADVGQGAHTAFIQMAAEALGLPFEKVQLVASDTAVTRNSGSVSASRMTFMAGNAIRGAAAEALEKWKNEERPARAVHQYRPPRTTPLDPQTGKSEPNFAYGYVAEVVEIEVDQETGQIKLNNIICADDVGKAINPQQVQGQIEGAIVQAAGYAALENFVQVDGKVLTKTFSTYLIPTILDIPEKVTSVILEYADPIGPWGARGMGEMPYLPLVPAMAAAIKDATGVWFDQFPFTQERVYFGLNPE